MRAMASLMRAIRVSQFGGPEVLKMEEIPVPSPSPDQVLVKVQAVGINPVDTYIRSGTYARKPELPYTPGGDVSGIVLSVGQDVHQRKDGERVFTLGTDSGSCAEYAVVNSNMVGHLPDHMTFQEGAGIGVPYFTAYRAVVTRGKGCSGETILVHGASGGVGLACVQIAKHLGMRVLGTAGTDNGMELIKELGADYVFNHRKPGYTDNIWSVCGEVGPNLIVEMLANVNLQSDLEMAAPKGRIMIVGNRGNIEINPRLTMGKELSVQGIMLRMATQSVCGEVGPNLIVEMLANVNLQSDLEMAAPKGRIMEEWQQAWDFISNGLHSGSLKPHIHRCYNLEQTMEAHKDIIDSKGALGKLVISL